MLADDFAHNIILALDFVILALERFVACIDPIGQFLLGNSKRAIAQACLVRQLDLLLVLLVSGDDALDVVLVSAARRINLGL